MAALALPLVACGSDDESDNGDLDEPAVENLQEDDVPFDPSVEDGVDTNVEQSGNLNFDNEQPGFDD